MAEEAFVIRASVPYLDLGILAGDLLTVARADSAVAGEIVVADVGGEWSVRRFVPGVLVKGRLLEVARRVV